MPSQEDELRATLEDLRKTLDDAPPEMRAIVQQQIAALENAIGMLESVEVERARMVSRRPALSPQEVAFFRPEAPAEVPTWIPDSLTRAQVTDDLLRCAADARIYAFPDSVGCAVPRPNGSIPIRHGLQLWFHHEGHLRSQSFYEHGLSRWAVAYHATGGRERVGWYADREPMVYLEHGLHTRFAPNGTIVAQATFIAGLQHGWSKFWEDDGFPIGATFYDQGKATRHSYPGHTTA